MQTLSGIPTTYRGITFRSRLEAQWAAFFDIVGWRWVYEPISYNGWLPDFAIEAKGCPQNTLLCEVKPVFDRPDAVFKKIDDASPVNLEVLVLGMSPFSGCGPSIGWLRERLKDDQAGYDSGRADPWWEDAVTTSVGGTIGLCHAFGSFHCRITGAYDGDSGLWRPDLDELLAIWGQAHDRIRWHPMVA